jgi:hypothetical protein
VKVAGTLKQPVALSDEDFLPDEPARQRRKNEPIEGKLVDSRSDEASAAGEHGIARLLEPLLKTRSPTDASLVLTGLVALVATCAGYWLVL